MKKYLGVQFSYQDEDKKNINSGEKTAGSLDPESIAELPEDARNTLLEATVNLDQESFFTALEQLPLLHKKIAVALRVLVENYRFEDVENILGRKK
ncbi:MAG: hypothetical protein D3903_10150 [Candidatus Electrothrix sp. GM3_4]|nr:hypothetical protein [Candidatus Electrothrix sp. GM3_4]